ncbi:hypothetical protein ANN_10513 [Periplaneta americana]|uniref:Mab-21-like nucleotidyltransferase domain-containing protein n=1 Tax=Periplaneta americana TaxID=6978 RepID=A0ABQ8TPH0_PERAM|nr:hypothetical protein ANN_10513 [Periplaneta americana]
MDLREVGYDDRDWINLAQDGDQWRAYVRAAMNLRVLLELTERKMKTIDETFQELYCQPIFVGSYYENLRVGHPNEFDINLELRLPISNSNIMIETSKTEPGFAKIKVNKKFHPHVSQAVINARLMAEASKGMAIGRARNDYRKPMVALLSVLTCVCWHAEGGEMRADGSAVSSKKMNK